MVKVLKDSVSENDVRITTLLCEYPAFIHEHILTHRVFSRNSSSSRAILGEDVIDQVVNNPVKPAYWGVEKKGMVAKDELSLEDQVTANAIWMAARDSAVYYATLLNNLKVHKQIANRLLKPWQVISTIITSTEWDNFFNLRLATDTQPETREVAKGIKYAIDHSVPQLLKEGEWHLPLCDDVHSPNALIESVARCAAISRNKTDVLNEESLFNRLLNNGHLSPFEHQATPIEGEYFNLTGWKSLRYHIEK